MKQWTGQALLAIPIVYFTSLGVYDIGAAILEGKLTWYHTLFNTAFFLPVILRRRKMYLICGVCFTALWSYLFVGGMAILLSDTRERMEQGWIMAPVFFSLLCSISLWYVGSRKHLSLVPQQRQPLHS